MGRTVTETVLRDNLEAAIGRCCDTENSAVPCADPPPLLGGSKCQGSLTIDWLQGSFEREKTPQVLEILRSLFGAGAVWQEWGRYSYDRGVVWQAWDLAVYYRDDMANDPTAGRSMVRVPGSALSSLTPLEVRELVDRLAGVGFRSTRIDFAFDDYRKLVMPRQAYAWHESGATSGFRVAEFKETTKLDQEERDECVWFGRRGKNGSGKFLRCYRKDLESGGRIDAVRWELELSKESAHLAFSGLVGAEDLAAFEAIIGAVIGGSIDFVNRNEGDRKSRCGRISEWAIIIETIGEVHMRPRRSQGTIEQTEKWIGKSVAGSLAMVREARGGESFDAWLAAVVEGVELNDRHRSLLERHRRDAKAECHEFFDRVGRSPSPVGASPRKVGGLL